MDTIYIFSVAMLCIASLLIVLTCCCKKNKFNNDEEQYNLRELLKSNPMEV